MSTISSSNPSTQHSANTLPPSVSLKDKAQELAVHNPKKPDGMMAKGQKNEKPFTMAELNAKKSQVPQHRQSIIDVTVWSDAHRHNLVLSFIEAVRTGEIESASSVPGPHNLSKSAQNDNRLSEPEQYYFMDAALIAWSANPKIGKAVIFKPSDQRRALRVFTRGIEKNDNARRIFIDVLEARIPNFTGEFQKEAQKALNRLKSHK